MSQDVSSKNGPILQLRKPVWKPAFTFLVKDSNICSASAIGECPWTQLSVTCVDI